MNKNLHRLQILTLVFIGLFHLSSFQGEQISEQQDLSSETFMAYTFKGVVKSISFGDGSTMEPIRIKFQNLNKGAVDKTLVVKVCDTNHLTEPTLLKEHKLRAIQNAMSQKTPMTVSYDNGFDRCLKHFTIHQEG